MVVVCQSFFWNCKVRLYLNKNYIGCVCRWHFKNMICFSNGLQ